MVRHHLFREFTHYIQLLRESTQIVREFTHILREFTQIMHLFRELFGEFTHCGCHIGINNTGDFAYLDCVNSLVEVEISKTFG